jgi:DNA (cytosine-5)-methyltransferase 1
VDPRPARVLSLCSGYGGIDLGLELAIRAARTVGYVEIEATAAQVLVSRMEDGAIASAPVWSDLKTFRGKPWRGCVDILAAGYPCQPFSCAGLQRGDEDPRHLWPHVARIIRETQPPVVFLENVENHLRVGFEQVARELRGMGYQLEAGIFSAEESRAPHLRKRLFVMAYRASGGLGILRQSSAFDGQPDWRDEAVADAGDRLLQVARRRPEERARPRPAVQELADAQHTGQLRRRIRALESSRKAGAAARPSANVADAAGGQREQLRGPQPITKRRLQRPDRYSRPFPPGPADLDGWREYLAEHPEAEPAICRSADGTASRVDRLRMLGNGVVPIVAAYAFCTLARAAVAANDATNGVTMAAAA